MSEAGLVVTLVALFGAVLSLVRWRNKPQFVCGVLPLEAELADPRFDAQNLGRRSLTKAFRFEPRYFAMRLRRSNVADLAPAFRNRLQSDLSCRRVTVAACGTLSLPVILANYGGRTATGLTCSVILSAPGSNVKLCDAEVESLDYRWFELLFTINCSDGFVRAETYVQAIYAQACGAAAG